MTRVIVVRLRHGKRLHVVTEGADSPDLTICRREATSSVPVDGVVDCPTCAAFVEKHGR